MLETINLRTGEKTDMKKILFLCLDLYTFGGIQRVMSTMLHPLADYGDLDITVMMPYAENEEDIFGIDHRVHIVNEYAYPFFGKNTPNGLFHKALQRISRQTGCFFFLKSKDFLGRLFFPPSKIRKISEYIKKQGFDCVVGVGDLYIVLVSLLDCGKKVKRIGWSHSSFDGYYCVRGRNCYGLLKSCASAFKTIDLFLVLTAKDKADYEKAFHKPTFCLYNPVDVTVDSATASMEKPIIFCGRMEREVKGLDYLLEIIQKINAMDCSRSFVIIGGGPDEKWIRAEIQKRKLEKYVTVTGRTNETDKYYRNGALLIHTSRWEGFGLVLLEAMSYGMPVVAFHNNGPDEIVTDGVDGILIDKYDCDQFAVSVLDVLNNPDKYTRMSEKAKQKSKEYTPENLSKQLYEHIVS